MHTVVETPSYLTSAETLLGEQGMRALVSRLASDPEVGEVIPGTGGFRKVRTARPGMGKRGGVRVIYIYRNARFSGVPGQGLREECSGEPDCAERNALKKRADEIFETYGVKR
jgi:hypothetical protein